MALKDDLLDLFNNMHSDPTHYTDVEFYTTISQLIADYASSLKLTSVSVVGSDTSPTGAFVGSVADGDGELKVSGSTIKSKLKAACDMKANMTDEVLAQAFADGVDGDTVQFTVTIKGKTTTTTTPPQTLDSQDSGVVTAVFSSSSLLKALKDLFKQQKEDYEHAKDEDFATTLASEVKNYYTKPTVCTVAGSSHLASCIGTCQIAE